MGWQRTRGRTGADWIMCYGTNTCIYRGQPSDAVCIVGVCWACMTIGQILHFLTMCWDGQVMRYVPGQNAIPLPTRMFSRMCFDDHQSIGGIRRLSRFEMLDSQTHQYPMR